MRVIVGCVVLSLCASSLAQEPQTFLGVYCDSVAVNEKWVVAAGKKPGDIQATLRGTDGELKVWDVQSGEELLHLTDPEKEFHAVALSPKGAVLAVGCREKGIQPFQIRAGEKPASKRYPLFLWDVARKKKLMTISEAYTFYCLAFSPDGKWLASGGIDIMGDSPVVSLWELPSGERKHRWTMEKIIEKKDGSSYRDLIESVAFSPDSSYLVFGGTHGVLHIVDLKTGEISLQLSGHSGKVNAIAFSPDGKWLASGSADESVRLYDWRKKEVVSTFKPNKGLFQGLVFGADSTTLFTSGIDQGENRTFYGTWKAWQVPKMRLLHTARRDASSIPSIALSPDGQKLATGFTDGLRIWPIPKVWKAVP
jgi:dipeptidyl aminopeptidase/acylaminoacyl peptidase